MNSSPVGAAVRFACITSLTLSVSTLTTLAEADSILPEPPQQTVAYGDLELTRTTGIAKLYRRIALAAAQVCDVTNRKSAQNAARAKNCETQAIADAVSRVGSPGLSKYHASRNGQIDTARTAAAVQP
jgi:UrcA family protein